MIAHPRAGDIARMKSEWESWFKHLHDVKTNLVKAHDEARDPIERWFADEADLYSDTAHFVYELMQNADDAGATEALFRLKENGLVFVHNGKRRFRVSSIEQKEDDIRSGNYGEVNALTDRNGTTKKADNEAGNAIGKFGRGFKSVYGYTKTPSIYDRDIRFRLDRIIIPVDLSAQPDYPGRNENETVIVLPFDRQEKQNPAQEIFEKFRSLVMPTLFLHNLKKVSYEFESSKGYYEKRTIGECAIEKLSDPPDVERIDMIHSEGSCEKITKLLIFSRMATCRLRCSVGFVLNDNGRVVKSPFTNAFCYFPTRHETGLNFIIHAPFKLNATREGIKDEVQEPHNGGMVRFLASIAADGIECLRYITDNVGKPLLDDDIVDVVPTRRVSKADYRDRLDLSPFYTSIKTRFMVKEMLPASHGYVKRDNGCWPESQDLSNIFTHEQLRCLLGRSDVDWVFPSRWADRQREEKYDYINELVQQRCTENSVLQKITPNFVEAQTREWLYSFLKWISSNVKRVRGAEALPIFLNQRSKPCAAKNATGEVILFLPNDDGSCSESRKDNTVHQDMLHNEDACRLLREYGVRKPNPEDEVLSIIRGDDWSSSDRETHLAAFGIVAELYFSDSATDTLRRVIEREMRQKSLLTKKRGEMSSCNNLYFPTELLSIYFAETKNCLVDFEEYSDALKKFRPEATDKLLYDLFSSIGVATLPRKLQFAYQGLESKKPYKGQREWGRSRGNADQGRAKWEELEYDGLASFLDGTVKTEENETKLSRSLTMWSLLTELQKHENKEMLPQGIHYYLPESKVKPLTESFDNYLRFRLQSEKWVLDMEGNWASPNETTVQRLDVRYKANEANNSFREMIGLKNDRKMELIEELRRIDPNLASNIFVALEEKGRKDRTDKGDAANRCSRFDVEDEKFLELNVEIKARLAECCKKPSLGVVEDFLRDGNAKVVSIPELLSMNLLIPDYQRPYKWDRENVWDFLDDIMRMVVNPHSERGCDWSALPYRMGSIILHQQQDGHYAIVDGQQRTLTFILLAIALGEECRLMSSRDFYPALSQMPESRRNLNNNLHYICEYFKTHGNNFKDDFQKALEESLQVVVVCVSEQDQAFQLFDSQNVKGRRLEPHDLLKAYHLRELEESLKSCPNCSNDANPVSRAVMEWENFKILDLSYLFDKLLYPILKWSGKERCYGFTTRDLKAFKGVPQRCLGKYGYVNRAFAAKGKYQIGSEFAPGLEFFDMVAHYQSLLGEVRKRAEKCEKVKAVLDSTCNNAYTKALVEAVLLAYFDRFGIAGLASEEVDAAIRSLCKWVFTVRLDLQYFSPKTPNKYALGVIDGSVKYTNRIAMFSAIRNAVFHTDITKLPVEMSHVSLEDQNTDARKALWKAVNEL